MKNDFVKNKKNISKSKNKSNFFAFLVIIIVSLCSVLSCFFSALNYFGLSSGNIVTVNADEDESENIPTGYPNLLSGLVSDFTFYNWSSVKSKSDTSLKFTLGSYDFTTNYILIYTNVSLTFYAGQVYTIFCNISGFDYDYVSYGFYFGGLMGYKTANPLNSFTIAEDYTATYFSFFIRTPAPVHTDLAGATGYISFGIWQGSFNNSDFASSVYYQVGLLEGQSNGYSEGYTIGYREGLQSGLSSADSLGLFASCTFKYNYFYSTDLPGWNNNYFDYSSWSVLDSQYYEPHFNGVYFKDLNSQELGVLDNDPNYADIQRGYIVADFGISGIDIKAYNVWQVCYYVNNYLYGQGPFGTAVGFRFVDGTYLLFNNSDDYFSSVFIEDSYLNIKLRSIEFISVTDHNFFGLLTARDFQNVYSRGFNDGRVEGESKGYSSGYNIGYSYGYNEGYNLGLDSASNYSFLSLIGAVIDAPIRAMTGLLNFDLLGFNLLGFFVGLLTLGFILWVIKLLIGKK